MAEDFTISGVDFATPDLAPSAEQAAYSNPDPTARQTGFDPEGNPVWRLIDAGGRIVQWTVNRAGEAVNFKNLGYASQDARLTYAPTDPRVKRAGTDPTTGNPLFQLIDEGGNLIQYAVDWLGNAVGYKNLGAAKSTPAAGSVTPPAAGTTSGAVNKLLNGDIAGALDAITTGEGNTAGGGNVSVTNLTSNTPQTKTIFQADYSNRSTSTTTVNTSVNSADLVSKVVDSIAGLFKGGGIPVQASSGVLASDDLFGTAQTPGSRQAGMELDASRMSPGTNATPKPPAATITGDTGLGGLLTSENNRPILLVGVAIALATLFVLLRRRA